MDAEYLLKRRAAVVARHEVLASVPGSGWHADDARARAERNDGFAAIAARPVAIQNDNEFYVVGPCVAIVRDGLSRFAEEYRAAREAEATAATAAGVDAPEVVAQLRHADRVARKYVAEPADVLRLSSQDFNGLVYALSMVKVLVVVAGVLP